MELLQQRPLPSERRSSGRIGSISGGDPLSAFGIGAFSSMAGSGLQAAGVKSTGGIVAGGAITGGISAELTGGDFWQGAGQGAIIGGLNHSLHKLTEPGKWDLLSEKSFRFKNQGRFMRGARVTELFHTVVDMETGTVYKSKFTLEIGVPIKSRDGKIYSKIEAVDKSTLVLNSVATEAGFVATFIGPSGRKMALNSATLPYLFAARSQAKLNNYIPGSTITANTYNYNVWEQKAVYVNFFKGLFERLD